MKAFLMLMFVVVISSCSRDKSASENAQCTESYLFWGGDPLADGAGWYFSATRSSETRYYVEDVPPAFATDSTAVNVCLVETTKPIRCMCVGPRPNYYEIKSIRKR